MYQLPPLVGICGWMLGYMAITSADVKRKQRAQRKVFLRNGPVIKSFQLNCVAGASSSIDFIVLGFGQYTVQSLPKLFID